MVMEYKYGPPSNYYLSTQSREHRFVDFMASGFTVIINTASGLVVNSTTFLLLFL